MSAFLSFRNNASSFATARGTTVQAGALSNLLKRQLERGVVLNGGDSLGKWLDVSLPQPEIGALPPTPHLHYVSKAGTRVIALLGLDLPIFKNVPPAMGGDQARIEVYGWYLDEANNEQFVLVASLNPYRDIPTEGEAGSCHRILCIPSAGEGLSYGKFRICLNLLANGARVPVRLGSVWVGNAIEFPDGVDADWAWSVQSAGGVEVSRGGQAYARAAPSLRTVRANISGKGLDARLAFGEGVTVPPTGVRRASDWLSDAAVHLGTTGNCVLVPRGDSQAWIQRTAVYGRLNAQPIQIDHLAGNYFRASLDVIEER